MGMYDEALSSYFAALELAPNDATRYYDIGDTYLALGDTDNAISFLWKATELDPGNTVALYDLGLAFFNAGRYWDCEAASRAAIQADPDMINGRTNLGLSATTNQGLAYLNLGKLTDAEHCFRQNLRLTASSYFNLGLALHRQERYDEALVNFLHAVELVPDDAEYWDLIGNAWLELDDLKKAQEALERSVAIDPDYAPANYDLGVVFSRAKVKENDAMNLFRKAVALDELFPLPYYAMACLQALEGKKKPALENLRNAVDRGFTDRKHADGDHDLDTLRDDPEFQKIMKRMAPKRARGDRFCADIEIREPAAVPEKKPQKKSRK